MAIEEVQAAKQPASVAGRKENRCDVSRHKPTGTDIHRHMREWSGREGKGGGQGAEDTPHLFPPPEPPKISRPAGRLALACSVFTAEASLPRCPFIDCRRIFAQTFFFKAEVPAPLYQPAGFELPAPTRQTVCSASRSARSMHARRILARVSTWGASRIVMWLPGTVWTSTPPAATVPQP